MDEKQIEQMFIESECCINQYFDKYIVPKLDFYCTCREDRRVSSLSTGIGVRNALLPGEEYASDVYFSYMSNDIEKVCQDFDRDKKLSSDLSVMAAGWRTAAVAKIGEDKYKEYCEKAGGDIADAFIRHRFAMKMVDYEVDRHPIKGSGQYISGEAKDNSMVLATIASWGGAKSDTLKPDLEKYIEYRIIKKYNPSALEKVSGKVIGSLSDLVVFAPLMASSSGYGVLVNVAKFVGTDVAISVAGDAIDDFSYSVDDMNLYVSKAIFSVRKDKFSEFAEQGRHVSPYQSDFVKIVNEQLSNKIISRMSHNPFLTTSANTFTDSFQRMNKFDLPDVPDYAEKLRLDCEMYWTMREKFGDGSQQTASKEGVTEEQTTSQQGNSTSVAPGSTKSVGGWGGMLDQLGLSGFGTVGKNLGYVLAMLPDMLIGMFTGKSRNLKFGDNLLPIGAIIAGMFVNNPLLKMLLIGLGGANLLNKAGHEALDHRDAKSQPVRQYRTYLDEPLDMRIKQPVLKGNTLVVNIDNIPLVITINNEAVDAYEKGVLPINTLANAVLRKYDEQQNAVAENYEQEVSQDNIVERSRGLK